MCTVAGFMLPPYYFIYSESSKVECLTSIQCIEFPSKILSISSDAMWNFFLHICDHTKNVISHVITFKICQIDLNGFLSDDFVMSVLFVGVLCSIQQFFWVVSFSPLFMPFAPVKKCARSFLSSKIHQMSERLISMSCHFC